MRAPLLDRRERLVGVLAPCGCRGLRPRGCRRRVRGCRPRRRRSEYRSPLLSLLIARRATRFAIAASAVVSRSPLLDGPGTTGASCAPRPPSATAGASSSSMPPPWSSMILLTIAQAEAGALLARRHIGLEQLLPVLRRQALAVVDDLDRRHSCRRRIDRDGDLPWPRCCLRHAGDRLGGVLDDVGEGLRHSRRSKRADDRLVAADRTSNAMSGWPTRIRNTTCLHALAEIVALDGAASACARRRRTRRPCA